MLTYRAKTIVTMDGPPIDNGAVAIEDDRIAAVGRHAEVLSRGGEVTDLGEVVILPGLINAHCHLDYTSLRGLIAPQRSFADWIRQINGLRRELTEEDYLESIARGFAEAKRWGTTAIANVESMPTLLERMAPPPIRTWWFAELIDVQPRFSAGQMIEQALAAFREKEKWPGGFGLSPHAPYTASPELSRLAAETARQRGLLLTTHLGESREEMEMFRDGRGPLFELLKTLGRPMDDCGAGKTPLATMLDRGLLDEGWIVVHLNELAEEDFARSRARAALSHRALSAQQPLLSAPALCLASVARPRFQRLPWDRQSRKQLLAQPFRRNANLARHASLARSGTNPRDGNSEWRARPASGASAGQNPLRLSGRSDRAPDRGPLRRSLRKDYRLGRGSALGNDGRRPKSGQLGQILIFAFPFLIPEIVSALRIWPRSSS